MIRDPGESQITNGGFKKEIEMIGPHSKFETGIWRTMRGELYPLNQITDNHLEKLIPYAERWVACWCINDFECECGTSTTENMEKWLQAFKEEKVRRQNANL